MARRQSVVMTTNDNAAINDSLTRQIREYEKVIQETEQVLEMKKRVLSNLRLELAKHLRDIRPEHGEDRTGSDAANDQRTPTTGINHKD